jgi:hypothetical protein
VAVALVGILAMVVMAAVGVTPLAMGILAPLVLAALAVAAVVVITMVPQGTTAVAALVEE